MHFKPPRMIFLSRNSSDDEVMYILVLEIQRNLGLD